MNIDIQIWNKAGTRVLSTLTADANDSNNRYENLELTKNRNGDATVTFDLKREPLSDYYEDLEDSNVVRAWIDGEFSWEGDIEGVERSVDTQSSFSVKCLGWSAKLKINGTEDDVAQNLAPGEAGSTYIKDHIVTDTDLGFDEGNIDTDDFEFVTGLEFYPGKDYWYILDEICKYQLYDWWVERSSDPRLPPTPRLCFGPRQTTVSYYVLLEDCDQSSLDRNRENLINWAQYGFTPTGSLYGYVTSEDSTSQTRHGVRKAWDSVSYKISQAEAQAIADTFIALHKDLKPNSALTTTIVHDVWKTLLPLGTLEPRAVLNIPDLLPTEETIQGAQGVNEMQTWNINEIKLSQDGKVSLSPGGLPTTLDVLLAGYDLRSRAIR